MSASDRFERVRESQSLSSTLDALRRRWPMVVGIVLACTVVAAIRHERAPKSYAATASVTFQSATLPDAVLSVTPTSSVDPEREAATNVLIARSSEVATRVRKQLKLPSTPSELLELVKVEAAENAEVLHIIAETEDPGYSAELANTFAEQYIDFKAASQLSTVEAARRQIQSQMSGLRLHSAARKSLEESLLRLGQLRAAAYGGENIIGRATPPTVPSGAGLSTTIVLGLVIGFAAAFTVVFLLESIDRRVRSIEEFERLYGAPVLVGVPQDYFRSGLAARRRDLLEPYRILRSALDFAAVTRRLDTLLVTSAIPGEGKTTVAVDLAHAFALAGRPVVLVELDLRRPSFHQHFELQTRTGATDALMHPEIVEELLVAPIAGLPNLLVLPAGRLPPNPSELLGTGNLARVLEALSIGERIVVIDSPPLNPVSDTQVILNSSSVHGCIVVARSERTTRDVARHARAILGRHVVQPLGIVITGLRDAGRYGYGVYQSSNAETSETLGSLPTAAPAVNGRSLSRPSGQQARWLLRRT